MNWLNLRTETLHAPQYIGSDPTRRATWISLMLWCAQQENGGIIAGSRQWPDRRWQQTCGVTAAEVAESCELFAWAGDNLVLWGYNTDKEAEVQAKRDAGRAISAKRWAMCRADSSATSSATSSVYTEVEGERERKENENRNEKKKEVQEETAGPASPPAAATPDALILASDPQPPAKPKRPRKQPAQTDAEWLASLAASPAYAGLDVGREYAKASEWCRVRTQTLSRQRFINWLNRADKPLTAPANAQRTATTGRHFSDCNDYSKTGI